LGITDPAVLLPTAKAEHNAGELSGIGDAVFRLDRSEALRTTPVA
jgi:hypothetical protein